MKTSPTTTPFRPRGLLVLALAIALTAASLFSSPASADSNAVGPISSEKLFITQQYRDFLGRDPDAGGLAFWESQLDAGAGSAAVINALATSPEFQGRIAPVVRLYYAYFLRAPDIDGLRFWATQLGSGATVIDVSQAFTLSDEFINTYGSLSDTDFVELVYQNVLDRDADADGLAFWTGQLAAGMSRGRVMLGFSDSVENIRAMDPIVKSTMLYVGMLGRAPEQDGLDYWAGVLRNGGSYTGVIGGFIRQQEYRDRMERLFPLRHPLTGERTDATNAGPALAVKVDNNQGAVPQKALQYADIVVEEEVEFNITRFIAIYHSEFPAVVGPVRSARTTDFGVLGAYNLPVMAASGGNPTVIQILNEFDGVAVTNRNRESTPNAYFRDGSRRAPHNLFARPGALLATAPGLSAPQQIFNYRESGVPSEVGVATNGVRINFGNTNVEYLWDPAARGWRRFQNGAIHRMDDGVIIAPDNVVVQESEHITSIADADTPEAITTGSGRVHVYTDGKYITGTWNRVNVSAPTTLIDDDGKEILLTPGETWVALTRPGIVSQR